MSFNEKAALEAAPKSDYSNYSLQTSQEAFVQGAKWMFEHITKSKETVVISEPKAYINFDKKVFLTTQDFQTLQALIGLRNNSLVNKLNNLQNYTLGMLSRHHTHFRIIE